MNSNYQRIYKISRVDIKKIEKELIMKALTLYSIKCNDENVQIEYLVEVLLIDRWIEQLFQAYNIDVAVSEIKLNSNLTQNKTKLNFFLNNYSVDVSLVGNSGDVEMIVYEKENKFNTFYLKNRNWGLLALIPIKNQ